jgi:hypothetical protein
VKEGVTPTLNSEGASRYVGYAKFQVVKKADKDQVTYLLGKSSRVKKVRQPRLFKKSAKLIVYQQPQQALYEDEELSVRIMNKN